MKNYQNIDLNKYSSIKHTFSVNEDNTVMVVKFSGLYRKGSLGNGDGIFMFSLLATHYYIFESITIILDLQDLDYEWGNTIFKSLNFFDEIGRDNDEKDKTVIIIPSAQNEMTIKEIESHLSNGRRIYCTSLEDAEARALKIVTEYLG